MRMPLVGYQHQAFYSCMAIDTQVRHIQISLYNQVKIEPDESIYQSRLCAKMSCEELRRAEAASRCSPGLDSRREAPRSATSRRPTQVTHFSRRPKSARRFPSSVDTPQVVTTETHADWKERSDSGARRLGWGCAESG
jgi:hypothetical protein